MGEAGRFKKEESESMESSMLRKLLSMVKGFLWILDTGLDAGCWWILAGAGQSFSVES